MPARISLRVHGDPIRMRGMNIVIGRVRVRAHQNRQAEFPAPGNQVAEHVVVAQPRTAMVKRNLRRVIGHAPTTAQAHGVRVCAFEIIQPKGEVKFAGIVLDQSQLCPAHRSVYPRWSQGRRHRQRFGTWKQARPELRQRHGNASHGGCFQELSACMR